MSNVLDQLKQPLLPVIVIENAESAVPLAKALLAGGLEVIEVTFRTEAAAEAIQRIKAEVPGMMVGAGTVVTPKQVEAAIGAKVDFGLAPGTNPDTVNAFKDAGIPFVPGVMTPSDIERALALDCTYLKFFPAEAAGGTKMLKNILAPYKSHGVKFCPTGGLNLANMNDYLTVPEVFAIGGSWLATPQQIKSNKWSEITLQVEAALRSIRVN